MGLLCTDGFISNHMYSHKYSGFSTKSTIMQLCHTIKVYFNFFSKKKNLQMEVNAVHYFSITTKHK